jgi:HK97 family phage prohead protease
MAIEIGSGVALDLEEKAVTESADIWTVSGYGAVFNNRDNGGDVIMPGAFQKSLRDHGLPLILFQHKADECPVGVCVDAHENSRGLWVKAELPKDDTFVAGRLVPQLKRKGMRGMSIGYRAQEIERRKSDNARLLKQVRLYEVSFVSMPMNPEANVESIKHLHPEDIADQFDELRRARR